MNVLFSWFFPADILDRKVRGNSIHLKNAILSLLEEERERKGKARKKEMQGKGKAEERKDSTMCLDPHALKNMNE